MDAPVRAALALHDAQGVPESCQGVPGLMEKYDYEIAFADLWVGKLLDGDRGDWA